MTKKEKLAAFFEQESIWMEQVKHLRQLALSTEVEETYKWQFPTYTIEGKNVFALAQFKDWFGIWFFQGVFLSDPRGALTNAQEGKTKAMRHWKFQEVNNLPDKDIIFYMEEAIQNQRDGKVVPNSKPQKSSSTEPIEVPPLLRDAFANDPILVKAFQSLSTAKQRGHCDYINTAKQEATKAKRLTKILPLIKNGNSIAALYGGK